MLRLFLARLTRPDVSEDCETGLVSRESKQYYIIVYTVHAVPRLMVIVLGLPLTTDEVHNFVLPFTRGV